ncbi:MAG: CBS domain-containing protein [Bacillus sp. (in: firmicutes)]
MSTTTDRSLSERFETAFNRIHKALKENVTNAKSDKFTDLVRQGKKHGVIRYYEADLCQFAKLRNAIVHEKIDDGYYIAEPHEDIVKKIEKIADAFEKPSSALSISTKKVYSFRETDPLSEVLKVINKYGYSEFPIYDEKGQYRWLLTSAEIVKYLSAYFNEDNINLKRVKLLDLYDEKKDYHVRFVDQNATVFETEDLFEEFHKNNKKLECIIITAKGTTVEEPNGIITSSDLLIEQITE